MKTTTDTESAARDAFPVKELYIDTGKQNGWGADLQLSIVETEKTAAAIIYTANSFYKKENVGFQIILPLEKKVAMQEMMLRSTGEKSDHFIRLLAKLYNEKIDQKTLFTSFKKVKFISLDEFAKDESGEMREDESGTSNLKVFFDSCELFLNINEKQHWIEIKEKDDSYRKQILKELTTK